MIEMVSMFEMVQANYYGQSPFNSVQSLSVCTLCNVQP